MDRALRTRFFQVEWVIAFGERDPPRFQVAVVRQFDGIVPCGTPTDSDGRLCYAARRDQEEDGPFPG
ncbi:MAG: hypothetical protein N2689_17545, partial [Verrucomicrobiae bacterium]|nr:hypothetical protein [Verrucomicrobiae bacterium]